MESLILLGLEKTPSYGVVDLLFEFGKSAVNHCRRFLPGYVFVRTFSVPDFFKERVLGFFYIDSVHDAFDVGVKCFLVTIVGNRVSREQRVGKFVRYEELSVRLSVRVDGYPSVFRESYDCERVSHSLSVRAYRVSMQRGNLRPISYLASREDEPVLQDRLLHSGYREAFRVSRYFSCLAVLFERRLQRCSIAFRSRV